MATSKKHSQKIEPYSFSKSLMYQIHTMMFLTEKRLERVLTGASPLSFSQFVILMGIQCQSAEHRTQSTLAEYLHMTEATISRHMKTLGEEGFLTKEASTTSKKTKLLTLTAKGTGALGKAERIIEKELDHIFSSLSEESKRTLHKQFETLHLSLLSPK